MEHNGLSKAMTPDEKRKFEKWFDKTTKQYNKDNQTTVWDPRNILALGTKYSIAFGERSNGKTFNAIVYFLLECVCKNKQLAYIRRFDSEITEPKMKSFFDPMVNLGIISKITNGEYTDVKYYRHQFFFCNYDEDGKITSKAEEPFMTCFALNIQEKYKSMAFPFYDLIIFDEFITRKPYLAQEFVEFMNLLSTIIRKRKNVKIFMLANTVNQYCPYFAEMGITNVRNMKQGTIDVYTYSNNDLKVAVEYCKNAGGSKENTAYFAFDNPKLKMITGGDWELDLYPHCPYKWRPCEEVFQFFIDFDGELFQGKIISSPQGPFVYINSKTTNIKYDSDIVFTNAASHRLNIRTSWMKPSLKFEYILRDLYIQNKFFYQDNLVGESIRNFLQS